MEIFWRFSILALVCLASGRVIREDQVEVLRNGCLGTKWDAWIKCFDANDDGITSLVDLEQTCNGFTHLHGLTGREKTNAEEKFYQWWKMILLLNGTEISPEEFVVAQANAFLQDRYKFIYKMQKGEEFFNSILDVDGDGYISEKEEGIFLVAVGQTDEWKNYKFFQSLDPEEKGEPVEKMTNIWVDYLTNGQCSEIEEAIRYLDQKE